MHTTSQLQSSQHTYVIVHDSQVHEGNKRMHDANKCTKATTTLHELRDANIQVDEAQQALVPYYGQNYGQLALWTILLTTSQYCIEHDIMNNFNGQVLGTKISQVNSCSIME
jgi:hypothetical protein